MTKISIDRLAVRLTRPFLVTGLATVGYHRVSLYFCLGAMGWHRHLDEDELFLGYTGTTTVETSWGDAALPPGHLVRVPKGLPHRCYSAAPTVVVLVQTRGLAGRRNGHQAHIGSTGQVEPVSLAQQAARITDVYSPRRVALADGLAISVQVCLGAQDWHRHEGEQLILCHQGRLAVQSDGRDEVLGPGELLVVATGKLHRVVSLEPATAVTMAEVG